MTEVEWLTAKDPRSLIGASKVNLDPRKSRLFAVACARLVSHLFSDQRQDRGIETAERFADGLASNDERAAAWETVDESVSPSERQRDASWWADCAAGATLMGTGPHFSALKLAALVVREVATALPASLPIQLSFFHCVSINPFRRTAFDPRWRTSTTVGLAQTMYDARDFAAMPMLADALQDAGCEDADILAHCRGGGPHVRGCWVVDLVLGKS